MGQAQSMPEYPRSSPRRITEAEVKQRLEYERKKEEKVRKDKEKLMKEHERQRDHLISDVQKEIKRLNEEISKNWAQEFDDHRYHLYDKIDKNLNKPTNKTDVSGAHDYDEVQKKTLKILQETVTPMTEETKSPEVVNAKAENETSGLHADDDTELESFNKEDLFEDKIKTIYYLNGDEYTAEFPMFWISSVIYIV